MPMWILIWLVLLTGLLLFHIYMDIREMNSLRNEIADNLRAMNAKLAGRT